MCHYHSDTCKTPGKKKAIERHVGQGNPAPVLFHREEEREGERGGERDVGCRTHTVEFQPIAFQRSDHGQ